MPWANTRGNVLQAGLSLIYAKVAGDSSTRYYTLGDFFEGKVNAKEFVRKNKKGIPNGFSLDFKTAAKLMYTNKTKMMAVLNALSIYDLDFIVRTDNGIDFSSALLSNPYFGLNWKFVCEGDVDKDRYIEISIDRRLIGSEWTTVRGTIPALGAEDPGDALYAIRAMTEADVIAAGLSKIEFRLASSGSWDNVLGSFRKTKVIVELLTTTEQLGRSIGQKNVRVSVEAEALQSSGTELALIASGSSSFINALFDFKLTFAGDGMIMTLDNMANAQFSYDNDKDADDVSVVKLNIEGTITTTQLASLFT